MQLLALACLDLFSNSRRDLHFPRQFFPQDGLLWKDVYPTGRQHRAERREPNYGESGVVLTRPCAFSGVSEHPIQSPRPLKMRRCAYDDGDRGQNACGVISASQKQIPQVNDTRPDLRRARLRSRYSSSFHYRFTRSVAEPLGQSRTQGSHRNFERTF